MHLRSTIILSVTLLAGTARSQEAVELWEKPYPVSIQDNSFFIEEAFNQETRVVQHISSVTYFGSPVRALGTTFTQEWPVGGVQHQLSYVIPYASAGGEAGVGDLILNYRYQLFDKPDGVACAPRFSLILPTGDEAKGLGMGVVGMQVNIPASRRFSELLIAHLNAGVTLFPRVKGTTPRGGEVRRTLPTYATGASLIVLFHPNVNLLLEYLLQETGGIDDAGEVRFATSHILSPGLRAAINLGNLQIVPGVAVPVRLEHGNAEKGVFGYLSFEHGF